MDTWAYILLGVIIGGALCVLVLYLALRLVFSYFKNKLAAAIGPSVRITLLPKTPETEWHHGVEIKENGRYLEQKGFRRIDDFEIPEIQGTLCSCYLHPEGYGAIVYDHQKLASWIDFWQPLQGRGGLTVSSVTIGTHIESAPYNQKIFLPGVAVADLWERFDRHRRTLEPEQLRFLDADNFLSYLQAAYADDADWLNSRGGPSLDELRAELTADGTKVSDEQLEQVREIQFSAAQENLQLGLRMRFFESLETSEKMHFRADDLLPIHNALSEENLLEMLQSLVDDEEYEVTELPAVCKGLPPREAFEAFLALLPEILVFQKVGSLDFPLDTDFYLPPRALPVEIFPHKAILAEE